MTFHRRLRTSKMIKSLKLTLKSKKGTHWTIIRKKYSAKYLSIARIIPSHSWICLICCLGREVLKSLQAKVRKIIFFVSIRFAYTNLFTTSIKYNLLLLTKLSFIYNFIREIDQTASVSNLM